MRTCSPSTAHRKNQCGRILLKKTRRKKAMFQRGIRSVSYWTPIANSLIRKRERENRKGREVHITVYDEERYFKRDLWSYREKPRIQYSNACEGGVCDKKITMWGLGTFSSCDERSGATKGVTHCHDSRSINVSEDRFYSCQGRV